MGEDALAEIGDRAGGHHALADAVGRKGHLRKNIGGIYCNSLSYVN